LAEIPRTLTDARSQFETLPAHQCECQRLFPEDIEIIAEPEDSCRQCGDVDHRNHRQSQRDGKIFYYINDGVYHTFSALCTIIGPIFIPSGAGKRKFARWSGHLRQF